MCYIQRSLLLVTPLVRHAALAGQPTQRADRPLFSGEYYTIEQAGLASRSALRTRWRGSRCPRINSRTRQG